MSNFLDIQNILQSGYFTTSRARNTYSSFAESQSRPLTSSVPAMYRYAPRPLDEKKLHRRRSYPPPPSVEDEYVSLAKEHGGSVTPVLEEEPQSRGEIEQQPIMLEVHEHNPERRFIILPSSPKVSGSGAEDDVSRKKARRRKSTEQPSFDPRNGRRHDSSESTERPTSDDTLPSSGRRRSRQDLPPLETDVEENRIPAHYRSKSDASAARPDLTPPRQYRPYGQDFLSPEITEHRATGRDKAYYGYGRVSTDGDRSPTHSSPGAPSYRRWDSKHRATPSMEARPSSAFETSSFRRPISKDRINDPRRRDGNLSPQIDMRDNFEPYRSGAGGEAMKGHFPYRSREHSCSCDESFPSSRRRGNSIIIDDERDSGLSRRVSNGTRYTRSPSRTSTTPIQSAEFPGERIPTPRSSNTFPIDNEGRSQERWKSQLPYPDDDDTHGAWPGEPGSSDVAGQSPTGRASTASMPHIPPVVDGLVVQNDTGTRVRSPSAAPSPKSWQPPSFDPNRDGIRTDNTVGSYRRYSENRGRNGPQELPEIPECIHTEPVAGKMDWLTLPRTDFNICPDCYGRCFEHTEYRTHFQPMLRPTVNPIACDFGSSPWYRIAWLLILKHQVPDLQLLYRIANIMSVTRNQPCPCEHKAMRNWYTVMDPYTRRPVPEFTVCYQCAVAIESLLPNLDGVFVRLDARQEPTSSVCALHFSPERELFVLFFDAFETTSDKAYAINRKPDIGDLSMTLRRVLTLNECRKDRRVSDGYWYIMNFLPGFTVCGECYEAVVRPQRAEDSVIAQNFYQRPQQINTTATCQLYSRRMRDVFERACRRNDAAYLHEKVRERLQIEEVIHAKFLNLIKNGRDAWTDEQIIKLSREWKKWE